MTTTMPNAEISARRAGAPDGALVAVPAELLSTLLDASCAGAVALRAARDNMARLVAPDSDQAGFFAPYLTGVEIEAAKLGRAALALLDVLDRS